MSTTPNRAADVAAIDDWRAGWQAMPPSHATPAAGPRVAESNRDEKAAP